MKAFSYDFTQLDHCYFIPFPLFMVFRSFVILIVQFFLYIEFYVLIRVKVFYQDLTHLSHNLTVPYIHPIRTHYCYLSHPFTVPKNFLK